MFAIVEKSSEGAFVRVIGVFDAPRKAVEQYAAQLCRAESIAIEQIGRPAGLELAGGEEFADGQARYVPVL